MCLLRKIPVKISFEDQWKASRDKYHIPFSILRIVRKISKLTHYWKDLLWFHVKRKVILCFLLKLPRDMGMLFDDVLVLLACLV